MRRTLILPLLLLLLSLPGGFTILHLLGTKQPTAGPPVGTVSVPAIVRALRPNYPYSIIPGGAYSRNEVVAWNLKDPVVRSHYSGFRLAEARLVAAPRETYAYVSFRRSGQVFWTAKKLRIPKGELLISDGKNLARARCGNRLAQELPAEKTTQIADPPPELDLPPFSMAQFQRGVVPSLSAPVATPPIQVEAPVPLTSAKLIDPAYQQDWSTPALIAPAPAFSSSSASSASSIGSSATAVGKTGSSGSQPPPLSQGTQPNLVPEPAFQGVLGLVLLLPLLVLPALRHRRSR